MLYPGTKILRVGAVVMRYWPATLFVARVEQAATYGGITRRNGRKYQMAKKAHRNIIKKLSTTLNALKVSKHIARTVGEVQTSEGTLFQV